MRACAWVIRAAVALAALVSCSGKVGQTPPSPSTLDGGATETVAMRCIPETCAADVARGRAALDAADFGAALAAFRCGDTREASFGAGLLTVIQALEGTSATQVLADLGLPPFPSKDVFGPRGIFSRYASQWRGNGMIEMSDGQGGTRPLSFERGKQVVGDNRYIRMRSTTSLASLSLQLGMTRASVGTQIQLGCQTTGFVPYLSLTTDDASCSTPFACATDAGMIEVRAVGAAVGEKSEYNLRAVKVTCQPKGGTGTQTTHFLDGTLTTFLAPSGVDRSDLHPLISDDEPFATLPATTTLGQVAADASGLRESLDLAACYFKAAGTGPAGTIFEIPGSVFGAMPVTVTGADAKLLAGAAGSLAGTLEILRAYELPMVLSGLLCGGSIACISDEAAVTRVNAGLGRLLSADLVGGARTRFADAAGLAAEAFGELSAESIILRTPETAPALDRAKDYVQWAHDSIVGQNPLIPHVHPPLQIDLAGPFQSPPDPAQIPDKPLRYDPVSRSVKVVDAFMRAAFPTWSNLEWSQMFWDRFEADSLPPEVRTDMVGRRLEGYGLAGD